MTLALISDIHHGPDSAYVRGRAALPLLEAALGRVTQRRPDLLIDLGDRINDADVDAARASLREVANRLGRVRALRAHLLGNDDVVPPREQEAILGAPLGNRSLEVQGWQLIFLDTFDGSVGGSLTPETLAWLERTLAANDLPALVFSHQPLDGQLLPGNMFFGGAYSYQAHPRGHEAARRILERSDKVKLVVSGHAHWNHSVTVGGICYFTLAALVPFNQGADRGGFYGLLALDSALHFEVYRCGTQERQFQRVVKLEKNDA